MTDAGSEATLVGRAAECAQLEELLVRARNGESATLVMRGGAGVGKSALLDYAAARAAGLTVLHVKGTEAEADLAFAGLFGLLRPILDKLDQLPEPQGRALAAAFGLAESHSPDRFLISAAALSLLAVAAEEAPLLCLIDDAQWLDQPSSEALVFVARRLEADSVALLFTASEWEGRRFDASGLPDLTLAGVDSAAAEDILDASAAGLAPAVRARLLAEAAGNPLALRELPHGLSDNERSGRSPLPEQLPLTPRLRELFERKIRLLPAAGRDALLVCALDGTADAGVVLRALTVLGLTADSLAGAEEAGLVRTAGESVDFVHPLVRAAAIQAAPLAERQRVHLALADALSGDEQLDRRVWHQAMAALTGDEEVALALEASARRAQERGGHASASVAFQRAAELGRDQSRLAERLAAAAEAAWRGGEIQPARALVARALRFAEEDLRPRLLHLQGLAEIADDSFRTGAETLLEAARSSKDESQKLEILVDVLEPALQSGFPEELAVDLAKQAEELSPRNALDAFNRAVVLWYGKQCARQFVEARPVLGEAMRLAVQTDDDPRGQYWAAALATMGLAEGAGLPFARRAVVLARRQGRFDLLPTLTAALAFELAGNSLFDDAYAEAGDGRQLALDMGLNPAWHLLTLARVDAIRGDAVAARRHVEEMLAYRGNAWIGLATARGAILGLLELGVGDPATAVEHLLEVAAGERLNTEAAARVPDLIEAIVRSGRPVELAAASLERLRRASSADTRARNSLLARCEALLGVRPPGEAFASALELADALSPFERARTELLYGEWKRRERQRKEARSHLRVAADEFRRLGATPWQERAEAELRATGETARKREPSTRGQLTPQERQIANLAAEGHTNPEIAAQLFLSPRTVEYHLRKVFSKLGIAGRTELVRRGAAALAPE